MRKIKLFAGVFRQSLTIFAYYRDILKAKFSFSLKYLYFLLFLISLVNGILFASQLSYLLPEIDPFIKKLETVAYKLYPEELEIKVTGAKIATNQSEPYYISFPEEFGKLEGFDYLAVIDTQGEVEDFLTYKSVFLLTEKNVVFPDENSENKETFSAYRVYPLDQALADVPSGTVITYREYQEILTKLLPYLAYLKPLVLAFLFLAILIFPFFAAFFGLLAKLVYLLLFSLPVWLLAKALKRKLGYRDTFRLGMHGLTPGILIAFGLSLFNITLGFWLYTLIFLTFMAIVVSKLKA